MQVAHASEYGRVRVRAREDHVCVIVTGERARDDDRRCTNNKNARRRCGGDQKRERAAEQTRGDDNDDERRQFARPAMAAAALSGVVAAGGEGGEWKSERAMRNNRRASPLALGVLKSASVVSTAAADESTVV